MGIVDNSEIWLKIRIKIMLKNTESKQKANEKVEYSFEIPDVHPSLNVWTNWHWTKKYEVKNEWTKMINVLVKEAKIPRMNFPVEIYIVYHHPKETVDLDNYTPKFILDSIKFLFVDDSIKFVKKLGWEFVLGKHKKSVVFIREY